MAQTGNHTPGPWRTVVRANQHGPQMVAVDMPPRGAWHVTRARLTDEDVANARLIAAAPELLEALSALDRMNRGLDWCDPDEQARRWSCARAAIAKATGEAK